MPIVYINLYRSGVYHRQGKPGTANVHGGDVYATERAALESAEPDRGYITTVPLTLALPDGVELYVNAEDSTPTPLSVTQRKPETLLPWTQESVLRSIETGEQDASEVSYREWFNRKAAGFYKPTHGGYPG